METKQQELFETDSNDVSEEEFSNVKDKEYYEVKIGAERFRKMKMENDLKAGMLVYISDVENAWRENCEILQSFFHNFTEVLPFESVGKNIDEILKLHVAAVEDCKNKLASAFENYMQEKKTQNA